MLRLLMYLFNRFLALLRLSSQPVLIHHPTPATLVSLDKLTGEKRSTRLDEVLQRCKSLVGREAWYTPTAWLSSCVPSSSI
jgi:hypothetical protein